MLITDPMTGRHSRETQLDTPICRWPLVNSITEVLTGRVVEISELFTGRRSRLWSNVPNPLLFLSFEVTEAVVESTSTRMVTWRSHGLNILVPDQSQSGSY